MRPLDPSAPRYILVRATNWVGDAVMTLPALEALAAACPQAELTVLAKPWVAPVYAAALCKPKVMILEARGIHQGALGRLRLAKELRSMGFDWAVLFQNAFEAGFIVWWARIPVRAGYASDGRGPLLTHGLKRTPAVRQLHETSYYLHVLHGAGILPQESPPEGVQPELQLPAEYEKWADEFLASNGLQGSRLLGLAPGAAFGPAKCWPADRFASAAQELVQDGYDAVLLFGSPGEAATTAQVAAEFDEVKVMDLAGRTDLGQALALLKRLSMFLTNDSGLMHAAAALGAPTVAVFGSTNPVTTSPLGPEVALVRREVECSPCLKPECPRGDLICFDGITPQDVAAAARGLDHMNAAT
jgi:heptosyltransferase-2